VINIATDLKSSLLAWLAVALATLTGGVVAWVAHVAGSGRPVHRAIAIAGVVGVVLVVVLGALALVPTFAAENDRSREVAEKEHQSQAPNTSPITAPIATPPTTTPVDRQSQTPTPARVIQNVSSYKLISSSDFCPTGDKVDLDTARSGYGGQPQLGDFMEECRVEGGLAELILEQDELHTPKNSPLLYLLGAAGTNDQGTCRDALRQSERLRSRVSLSELNVGDHMCVKTDQGSVSQVSITSVTRSVEAEMLIQFTTWG
jgi:hypothetical protein